MSRLALFIYILYVLPNIPQQVVYGKKFSSSPERPGVGGVPFQKGVVMRVLWCVVSLVLLCGAAAAQESRDIRIATNLYLVRATLSPNVADEEQEFSGLLSALLSAGGGFSVHHKSFYGALTMTPRGSTVKYVGDDADVFSEIFGDGKIVMDYVELAAMAKLDIPLEPGSKIVPFVMLGPVIGFRATCSVSLGFEGETDDEETAAGTLAVNCNKLIDSGKLDVGVSGGGGATALLGNSWFVAADGVYYHGFKSVMIEDEGIKHRYFKAGMSFGRVF